MSRRLNPDDLEPCIERAEELHEQIRLAIACAAADPELCAMLREMRDATNVSEKLLRSILNRHTPL